MALIRPEQFYAAKLTRPLSLGGSETDVYVSTLPTETTGSVVVNPRSSRFREKITYTGTSTVGGNHLTGCVRGVAFATATGVQTIVTRNASLCLRHSVGESVEMVPGHYESLMSDILNGIGSMVNDINMGGFQFTNVGTPTLPGHVATKAYADAIAAAGGPNASTTVQGLVEMATDAEGTNGTATGGTGASLVLTPLQVAKNRQNSDHVYAATAVGTDSYAITVTPAVTAYAAGQVFFFKTDVGNTGAATLNVSGLGAKNIHKAIGVALETNDIAAGQMVCVAYDGTQFQLMSPNNRLNGIATTIYDEMNTFFQNTSMTGAQAEILKGGPTSNADTLHTHALENGPITFSETIIDENVTLSSTLGTITRSTPMSSSSAGSGSNGIRMQVTTPYSPDFSSSQNFSLAWQPEYSTTQDIFLGWGANSDGIAPATDNVLTKRHVAFLIADSTIVASVANGTTQTTAAVTGVTLNNTTTNMYQIVYTAGVDAKFYVNGVLKATISTNLPSGSTDYSMFKMACRRDSGDSGMYWGPITIRIATPF